MAIITTRIKPKDPQLVRYTAARKTLDEDQGLQWLAETFRLNKEALAIIKPGVLYEVDYEIMQYDTGEITRYSGLVAVRKVSPYQVHFHTYVSIPTDDKDGGFDLGAVPINFAGAQGVWRETRIIKAAPATTERIPIYITMKDTGSSSIPVLDALSDMLKTGKAVL